MLIIKIRLKSYSSFLIENFIKELLQRIESFCQIIMKENYNNGITKPKERKYIINKNDKKFNFDEGIKVTSISLPNKRKYFTVLRSAHVHKKSREQFLLKIHSKCLYIDLTGILYISRNSEVLREKMPELFIIDKIKKFCKHSSAGIQCTIYYIQQGVYF